MYVLSDFAVMVHNNKATSLQNRIDLGIRRV